MNQRSTDPRPGDRVKIQLEDSIFTGLEGTVRNVYKQDRQLVLSVVVHPTDASDFIRKTLPAAPDGGYHTILTRNEVDILKRSIHT